MKKIFTILLLVTSLAAKSQTFTDPVDYNDYIVNLQNKIGEKLIAFNEQVASETASYASVEPYFLAMGAEMQDAVTKIKTLPAFEGNADLRNAAEGLFDFYLHTYQNEYKSMLNLVFDPAFDAEDLATLQEILTRITEKEGILDGNFQAAQQAFTTKYNITLDRNELQDKIDGE